MSEPLSQDIVETAAVAAGAETVESSDETEQAALFINSAHKEFRRLTFALADRKKHSVSRVLEAVLFEPLEQVELLGKQEQQLFDICQQVMYNKGKVMRYAYDRMEQIKQGEKVDEQSEK
jgi:hypothetical protein